MHFSTVKHTTVAVLVGLVLAGTGCVVSASKYNRLEAESRALSEKNMALETELANVKHHAEELALKLYLAEQRLAQLDEGRTASQDAENRRR
ncbi:MAG: hypothetical protein D6741_11585 [Planctomycetota bacterium]|nr:MAG: hypothetical protein D6741_11585 [Planctomycetota bacterium]